MKHTCEDCRGPIPSGQAVIRSESFRRIHLHRDCAILRGIEVATLRQTVEAHLKPLRDAS